MFSSFNPNDLLPWINHAIRAYAIQITHHRAFELWSMSQLRSPWRSLEQVVYRLIAIHTVWPVTKTNSRNVQNSVNKTIKQNVHLKETLVLCTCMPKQFKYVNPHPQAACLLVLYNVSYNTQQIWNAVEKWMSNKFDTFLNEINIYLLFLSE